MITPAMTAQISNALTNWVSPAAMQALGWALLHFVWQGTALAAFASVLIALCRRASARYVVAVSALALMLLAPVATFIFYAQHSIAYPQHAGGGDSNVRLTWPIAASGPIASQDASSQDRSSQNSSLAGQFSGAWSRMRGYESLPWLVETWLLGVAFFSLRSAGGFFLLERERRRQSSVVSERVLEICHTLQDRLGLKRAIDYCECKWLQAPAVIGWFRPVVFLPVTALSGLSEDQLQAVIAHELAHIQRLDPFVNVFQVCVETLLFYHPAVWWLNKRIRAEREHCCDDVAVVVCGNAVEYARALTLMEEWRSAPVFAMAANRGPLTGRIVRVLGLKTLGTGMRGIGVTGSILCLTAALVAGNALVGMAHPPSARAASLWQTEAKPAASPQAAPSSTQSAKPSAAHSQSEAASASPSASGSATSAVSYIDAMKAAGLADLTVDELVAMKIQGITPDYVREIQALGFHPEPDGLVALKVQGITPQYVQDMRALGFSPDADKIIALKVQGVDAEYVRGLKEVGIQADADEIVGFKVQGVTPDYVRQLRAAGLTVDADEVIALKVQGVTPAYLQGLHDQGFNPSADEVVGMRVQGVTPEYIRDIRALGLNPSADELVGMKVQGVTPEYIKTLQSAGFKPSTDDIIGAKVQGVTPEFIERVKQHGFKDLTLEKVIELRRLGILDAKADL